MNKDFIYVVTSAFPFVPAELNLAHFSSTYIPADVAYRYLKLFNYNAVQVNATDVHSFWASTDGKNINNYKIKKFNDRYKKLYEIMNIQYDNYMQTSDEKHIKLTRSVIERLNEQKQLLKKEAFSYFCQNCSSFIPYKMVENKEIEKCPYCESKNFEKRTSQHYWLKLRDKREELLEVINKIANQQDVKNFLLSQLDLLEDWDFTRDNNFGIKFPYDDKLTVYLWFESLIGYYSLILKYGYEKSKIKFIHFFGKNIMYYHGIVWPIILKYAINNEPKLVLSARGFLNENGSDKDMLDIGKLTQIYNADYLRFYIIYKVTDNIKDFKMTKRDFLETINKILISKIINLNYRVYNILKDVNKIPNNINKNNYFSNYIKMIEQKLEKNEINEILKIILNVIDRYNKKIANPLNRDINNKDNIVELAELCAFINVSLKPIMPKFIEEINIFDNYMFKSFEDIINIDGKYIKRKLNKISLLE